MRLLKLRAILFVNRAPTIPDFEKFLRFHASRLQISLASAANPP